MYVVDTSVFSELHHFNPDVWTSLWSRINQLVELGEWISVREVYREIEQNGRAEHVLKWVETNKKIFRIPSRKELLVVADLMQKQQNRDLVKRQSIIKGAPVADPFLIASAFVHGATLLTQESKKPGGARIPTVCALIGVKCMNFDGFLLEQHMQF